MNKFIKLGILVLLLGLFTVGCTSKNVTPKTIAKVGMITSGDPQKTFSEGYYSYLGLKNLSYKYGVTISYNANADNSNIQDYLGRYGKDNYDLVILIGSFDSNKISEISKTYPFMEIVSLGGNINEGKLHSLNYTFGDLGYGGGILLKNISKNSNCYFFGNEDEYTLRDYQNAINGYKSQDQKGNIKRISIPKNDKVSQVVSQMLKEKTGGAIIEGEDKVLESELVKAGIPKVVIGIAGNSSIEPTGEGRLVYNYASLIEKIYLCTLTGKNTTDLKESKSNILYQKESDMPEVANFMDKWISS